MSLMKTMFSRARFTARSQPADGIYHCQNLPASPGDIGLSSRAAGILLTFVPPETDFYRVSQA